MVASSLAKRFNITSDDSAGRKSIDTPPGVILRPCARSGCNAGIAQRAFWHVVRHPLDPGAGLINRRMSPAFTAARAAIITWCTPLGGGGGPPLFFSRALRHWHMRIKEYRAIKKTADSKWQKKMWAAVPVFRQPPRKSCRSNQAIGNVMWAFAQWLASTDKAQKRSRPSVGKVEAGVKTALAASCRYNITPWGFAALL